MNVAQIIGKAWTALPARQNQKIGATLCPDASVWLMEQDRTHPVKIGHDPEAPAIMVRQVGKKAPAPVTIMPLGAKPDHASGNAILLSVLNW